jgi:hypothetical protein
MKKVSVFFIVVLLSAGCVKDDEAYSAGNTLNTAIAELITISSVSKTTIEADNATISTIKLKVHIETDTIVKKINIAITGGTFVNGKTTDVVTADAYGNAAVDIKSNTPGTAYFTAKVKSVLLDTSITVIPSLPDDMLFITDTPIVDANASVVFTATLSRDPFRGIVNDPCKVFFVVTGTGSNSLAYLPYVMSADKKAMITITNPAHIKGTFVVEAQTLSSKGNTLKKPVTLTIQ